MHTLSDASVVLSHIHFAVFSAPVNFDNNRNMQTTNKTCATCLDLLVIIVKDVFVSISVLRASS